MKIFISQPMSDKTDEQIKSERESVKELLSMQYGEVEIIEKDAVVLDAQIKEEIKDLVTDPICHEQVEKTKAFHVIRNNESHYFCSWDCREKFLEPISKEHL